MYCFGRSDRVSERSCLRVCVCVNVSVREWCRQRRKIEQNEENREKISNYEFVYKNKQQEEEEQRRNE